MTGDPFTLRRLAAALERVPVETVTSINWDTEQGFEFLREVRAALRLGASWPDLVDMTGIDELKYVYLAREKVL